MNFSIVIPLYNENENVNQLNEELSSSLSKLQNKNHEFEIIYVDDGSTDNTLESLKALKNEIKTIILKNNKNLAQSKSIMNGMEVSSYNNIVLLDGDLQNDPKDIIKMVDVYSQKENILSVF